MQGFFSLVVSLDCQGRVCLRQRDVKTSAEHVVLIALKMRPYGDDKRDQANLGFGS